jgi:hypothetical protein
LKLFKKNIFSFIFELENNFCSHCGKSINIHDSKVTKFSESCDCKFCKDCAQNILNEMTEGKIILVEFEKSKILFDY